MIWLLFPAFLFLSLALCLPPHKDTPFIRTLAQFPNQTWVENIAIRANGQLLVTLFTSPDIYQINPFQYPNPIRKLVAHFPDAVGLLGIVEIEEDVFAVAKGIFTPSGDLTPRSFSVWKADFSGLRGHQKPALWPLAEVPDVIIVNGMTLVQKGAKVLLLADSLGGTVWRLDIETANYDVVLNNTNTAPVGTLVQGGFGVDGVHCRDGFLYFTNTNKGFFRVRIKDDGTVDGLVETLSRFTGGDDFTFDDRNVVYISRGGQQSVVRMFMNPAEKSNSNEVEFKQSDAKILLEGNTAVAFGRTVYDASTLYVTTNGGMDEL